MLLFDQGSITVALPTCAALRVASVAASASAAVLAAITLAGGNWSMIGVFGHWLTL
jgi:hypothetical protein